MARKAQIITDSTDNTRNTKLVDAPSAIVDYTVTWTSNAPTVSSTQTIADGTIPTVAELGQAVANIEAKLNAALSALRGAGVIEN